MELKRAKYVQKGKGNKERFLVCTESVAYIP